MIGIIVRMRLCVLSSKLTIVHHWLWEELLLGCKLHSLDPTLEILNGSWPHAA